MIFDIHAHPSLKSYVFGHDMTTDHPHPAKDLDTIDSQIDLPALTRGGVNAVVCAHYLIEKKFVDNWSPLVRLTSDLFQWFKHKKVVEDPSKKGKPFAQLLDIMSSFEKQIQDASRRGYSTGIPKTLMEFRIMLAQGKTVFLHSVEGSNCFNAWPASKTLEQGVDELAALGLCQFTIAHLENSELVPSQQGIPPGTKKTIGYKGGLPNPTKKLTDRALSVVSHVLDVGIIVDLVHSTPAVREQVYDLNTKRAKPRPLVFSHTGLRSIATQGDMGKRENGKLKYEHDLLNLPSDEEVKQVIRTRGVIGTIFANYWTVGIEEDDPFRTDNGIPGVIATMKKIMTLEKEVDPSYDCDHLSIGSDFDGFTQRPDDLYSPSCIPDLVEAMEQAGFSDSQIEKITWRNYMRVLELGWGN